MENKINIARFKEDYRTAEVKGIWQWDYGQILRIQGLNLPTAVEIHFSLDEHGGEAVRRIGLTKDGVTDVPIPDSMVENESVYGDSYYFFAYIYLTDETSGNTEYKIRAKVSTRSKPEGFVSGGNDTFAEILKTVNDISSEKVDIPAPAKVGQVIAVSEVDEEGRPTGFEATDQGGGVSDEKIAEAVGTYMEAHPLEETDPTVPEWAKQPEKPSYTAEEVGALPAGTKIPSKTSDLQNDSEFTTLALDETLTDNTKAAPAGMVGELKGDLEQLKQNGTGTGTGLSTEAIDKLEEVGNYLAYTTADGGSKWTELISILRNGSSGGGSGETVTLQSISATYTGGDVAVGTALTSLTGITVTAHYSDGSTANVTGYTLSGTIAEGSNTITVSYGGKTTTFTVVGKMETKEIIFVQGSEGSFYLNTKNLSRISAVQTEGNTALGVSDGSKYYPIDIPSGANTLKIVCPDLIPGINLYNIGKSRLLDSGWQTLGGYSINLTNYQDAVFATINFKNASDTNIDVTKDWQNIISITFE
ncbi:bacterial Ig-like domain-containing protein [Bariatricus sp. HCP3S3_E12]|uniref:bacterial Ig-like domain-containing protein n=1 Tax=Bariatricus sp. HCP3S3_E12 TaxID=3438906 RepID=UPI003F8C2183